MHGWGRRWRRRRQWRRLTRDYRRDAATKTDAAWQSASRPQPRLAEIPSRAAAPSHDPVTPRTPSRASFGSRTEPADGVGCLSTARGPPQQAQYTQDRQLFRPRTPSWAIPGLLQVQLPSCRCSYPPAGGLPRGTRGEKMRPLRRPPCALCAATAKTSAGVLFLEVHGRYSRSLLCPDSSGLNHHYTPYQHPCATRPARVRSVRVGRGFAGTRMD